MDLLIFLRNIVSLLRLINVLFIYNLSHLKLSHRRRIVILSFCFYIRILYCIEITYLLYCD